MVEKNGKGINPQIFLLGERQSQVLPLRNEGDLFCGLPRGVVN